MKCPRGGAWNHCMIQCRLVTRDRWSHRPFIFTSGRPSYKSLTFMYSQFPPTEECFTFSPPVDNSPTLLPGRVTAVPAGSLSSPFLFARNALHNTYGPFGLTRVTLCRLRRAQNGSQVTRRRIFSSLRYWANWRLVQVRNYQEWIAAYQSCVCVSIVMTSLLSHVLFRNLSLILTTHIYFPSILVPSLNCPKDTWWVILAL